VEGYYIAVRNVAPSLSMLHRLTVIARGLVKGFLEGGDGGGN
jgi:hypothetical protein